MEVRAASDFGALVAERREGLSLSQAELARRAGVTREWVVRLENGSTTVTLFRLMRVLRELGLVVDVSEVRRRVAGTRDDRHKTGIGPKRGVGTAAGPYVRPIRAE